VSKDCEAFSDRRPLTIVVPATLSGLFDISPVAFVPLSTQAPREYGSPEIMNTHEIRTCQSIRQQSTRTAPSSGGRERLPSALSWSVVLYRFLATRFVCASVSVEKSPNCQQRGREWTLTILIITVIDILSDKTGKEPTVLYKESRGQTKASIGVLIDGQPATLLFRGEKLQRKSRNAS